MVKMAEISKLCDSIMDAIRGVAAGKIYDATVTKFRVLDDGVTTIEIACEDKLLTITMEVT